MERNSEYLKKLWRPSIEKPENNNKIILSHNEAPFSVIKRLRRYPNCYKLYEKIAKYWNLNVNNILITAGSEQGIRFIFDAYVEPKDKIAYPWPTFGILDVFSYYRRANVIHLNYNKNRHINLETIPTDITLFYLANPDNPTGAAYSFIEIENALKHLKKAIFLLDEAYWGYYNINSLKLLKKYDNLIIVRSFSKAFGIAAARVGVIISNPEKIEVLRKLKPINELPGDSIKAALKALKKNNIVYKNRKQVEKWKSIFKNQKFINLKYVETFGNFILLETKHRIFFGEFLEINGIEIRYNFETPLQNHIRITVGTNKEMRKTLSILKQADSIFYKQHQNLIELQNHTKR